MNVGVCIEHDALYLAAKNTEKKQPSFYKSNIGLSVSDKNKTGGRILELEEGNEIKNAFIKAEKIALTIPAAICFSKRIAIDANLDRARSDYRSWVARNQLPGDLSNYIYGFLPLGDVPISDKIETLFYAALSDHFRPLLYAVAGEDDLCRVCAVPEYMGLAVILANAVDVSAGFQAVMVNIGCDGAAAVVIKAGSIFSTHYFPLRPGEANGLASDMAAYFLSVIDSDQEVAIYIAGGERLPLSIPNINARIKYTKMQAGFISALGSLEYITAGGICELPAGI